MADVLTMTVNTGPLARLGELVAVEVERVLRRLGEETEADAKQRAPVRTGFLRDSIHAEVEAPGTSLAVHAGAEYAGYVEFGTRRMAAQPFLTPAVDQAKGKLPDLVRDAFQEAARKSTGR